MENKKHKGSSSKGLTYCGGQRYCFEGDLTFLPGSSLNMAEGANAEGLGGGGTVDVFISPSYKGNKTNMTYAEIVSAMAGKPLTALRVLVDVSDLNNPQYGIVPIRVVLNDAGMEAMYVELFKNGSMRYELHLYQVKLGPNDGNKITRTQLPIAYALEAVAE